jgi:hypothetical protein
VLTGLNERGGSTGCDRQAHRQLYSTSAGRFLVVGELALLLLAVTPHGCCVHAVHEDDVRVRLYQHSPFVAL